MKTTTATAAGRRLAISLLLAAVSALLAAQPASAQQCTSAQVQETSFGLAFDSYDMWTDGGKLASGGAAVTYRRYCFKLSVNALRGSPPRACDPSSRCCRPDDAAFRAASFSFAAAPKCSDSRTASKVRTSWWTMGPSKDNRRSSAVTGTFRRAPSVAAAAASPPAYEVRVRRMSAVRSDDLVCVNIPVDSANACATMEDLCGGPTCRFKMTTTPVAPGEGACCITGAAALTCPDGSGGDPNDPGCRPCPAGTYGSGLKPSEACMPCTSGTFTSSPGSASCAACPAGRLVSPDRASCGGGCADGYGGGPSGECAACPPGTYGRGLGVTEPCRACEGPGEFSPQAGASRCLACPKGSLPNEERTACTSEH